MNRIERNYDYYNALKEASRQKTKTNSPETYNATEQERQDQTGEQNVLVRSGATVLDLATAIGTGMFKFGEGIVDSLVYLGGAVGGVFDENVRKDAENFIAKDYTGETFAPVQKQLNEWGSYLDDNPVGQTIEQVGQGVGQILPNVLLSVATGGASNALTMGTLGVSAAGNSVEEAFNDGADYGKAGLYGAARGLTEVATEKMFGGATKNIYGKGALDKTVGKVTGGALNKGLGKVVRNFAEEGIEEAVSELANPLAKSIYKGKDALAEYGTEDYWKGVGEQGLVGGLTGVVAGGTIGKINAKQTEIGENLQEIRKLENTAERMDANDTLSEEYDRRITNRIRDDYKQIESTLKSVNEEKRAKLIKQFNLSDVFDSDGGLNAEYTAERGLNVYDGQAVGDEGNGGVKSLASGSKYVSRRIRYSSTLAKDIEGLNESAKLKGIENPNVRVFDGELSDKGSANYTDTKSLLAKINRKTNNGINLVVIDSDAENIRGVTKRNTIYISKDALENGEGLRKTVHELVHVAQKGKTRQYKDLFNLLAEDEETTAKVIDSLTREGNGYGFTYETFEKIMEKGNTGERLTDIENEMLDEIGAWMGEAVLSDERIINRLVRDDTTFASNLINRIQDVSETLRSLKSPAAVKEYRRLKKTEAMYMQAIEAAGYKWSRGKIVGAKEDDKLDGNDETRYSFRGKKTVRYINKELDTPTLSFIRNELRKIYGSVDSAIADVIAIEKDESIFVVDSGVEDGLIDFGVRQQIKIDDDKLRKERLEKINDRAVSNGFISSEISGRIKRSSDNGGRSSVQRELQKELSDNTGKSENNESRIFREDAIDRSRRLRFSLKDSDGNELSPEQQEYFKNSKVVDKDGNLLVVYHGSPSKFTEFSHSFMNTNGNAHGRGFYFTENVEYANGFKKDGGQLLKGYLDIRKPASETEVTIKKSELVKLIKATCEAEAQELIDEDSYDNIDDALLDTWVSNYVNTYDAYSMDSVYRQVAESVFNSCDNDADIFAELTNSGAGTSRVLTLARKTIGYDGIIFDNGDGTHQFVSFESNQFKNADNIKPTKKQDFRFSLHEVNPVEPTSDKWFESLSLEELQDLIGETEAETIEAMPTKRERREAYVSKLYEEGKLNRVVTKLLKSKPQMAEYFANTKMNKRYDPLFPTKGDEYVVMFHGTPNDFNVFETKRIGKNGTVMGSGHYFTASLDYAERYKEDGGRVIATLLNIEKPLSRSKHEITKKDLRAFISTVVDATGDDYLSNYGDVYREGYDKVITKAVDRLYESNTNDADMIEEIYVTSRMDYDEFHDGLTDMLGYDGIIAWNKSEGTQAVVFRSNQAKDIFNFAPTENEDIRFSLYGRGNGYDGHSMSKNARLAYVNGEQPLSKWSKASIIDAIAEINSDIDVSKLNLDTLKGLFLKRAGWHHTSALYNATGFYTVDEEYIKGLTQEAVDKIAERQEKKSTTKRDKSLDDVVDEAYFKVQTIVKAGLLSTESGAVRRLLSGKGFDESYRKAIETIKKNDSNKVDAWRKLPADHYRQEYVKLYDNDIIEYIKKSYANRTLSRNSTMFKQMREYFAKKNTNQSSTPDTRFSMDGRKAKFVANNTGMKVYSKAESEEIINDILKNSLAFGDKYGDLSGKSKAEAADMLWKGLNSAKPGYRAEVALDVAEYIIQNSVIENIHDVAGNEKYMNDIAILKPYLHQINLDGIREEIKYRYNGDNSPFMLWGKRKGESGLGADVIARELEELGFRIDAENAAEIFFKIDETYREAVDRMKKEASIMVKSALTEEELEQLKQEISKQVLLAYDENGQPSKLSRILDGYIKRTEQWKDKYLSATEVNRLLDLVDKIKNIKLGTFVNASEYKSDIFKNSIEKLANIKYRGEINKSGTRNIIKGLREWYVKENPLLENSYDEVIAEMLDSIANGKGKLDSVDIQALTKIVDYFTHFVKNFNKVYRNNKYVEALPIAEKYADNIEFVAKYRKPTGSIKLLFNKIADGILDPISVAKRADGYTKGFWTDTLDELQEGAITESRILLELNEPLEKFFKANKSYYKRLEKETVKYKGVDMPVGKAISLCATYRRAQARPALEESGFVIRDKTNDIVFEPSTPAEIDGLYESLSKTDRQFLDIVEEIMEKCKNFKRNTDMQRKGYSNVLDDYYYPIRRAFVAVNIDTLSFSDLNSIMNFSFNKDTVKGAKGALCIDSVQNVLRRHISGIAKYCAYAMAIDNYDRLMNLNLGNNPNMPRSILSLSAQKGWRKGTDYFKKLLEDLKGKKSTDSVNKAMGFIRGSYAKFQLGANPKVWLTQGTSYVAAFSKLKLSSLVKGFGISGKDVDSYCELARIRNSDNTAARAQGVLDSVGKVGDFLMKPIGKADRLIIQRLFAACQAEASSMGYALGTEENKVKAGEILKEVILGTQQNAMATERSAMMRHDSEFARAATMFSADAMKVFSRFVDGIGEVSTLHRRLSEMRKEGISQDEISKVEEQLKLAKRKCAKATSSLVGQAFVMTLIATLFKKLYNKDDDDDFIVETVGNMVGGIPLLRDVYSFFADGYEVNNFFYDTVNSVLNNTAKVVNIAGDLANGKEVSQQEIAGATKGMTYAVGQLFGLPVRNVYNMTYGLTKRFDEAAAYKWDNLFRKKSFASDIGKAIEEDNLELASTIMSLWMNESGIGDNEKVSSELTKLYSEGFSVNPRNIGDSITYEGETYDLSAKDKANFRKIYSQATAMADKLISSKLYQNADSEVRAKAIRYIYDLYYNLGVGNVLNVDMQKKSVLFGMAIPQEILAMVVARASVLSADGDGTIKSKLQSFISSLNISAAQKYMLMGYLGYKNKNGEAQVKSYINRLSLTKEQKESLFKMSGYGD